MDFADTHQDKNKTCIRLKIFIILQLFVNFFNIFCPAIFCSNGTGRPSPALLQPASNLGIRNYKAGNINIKHFLIQFPNKIHQSWLIPINTKIYCSEAPAAVCRSHDATVFTETALTTIADAPPYAGKIEGWRICAGKMP